MDFQHINLRKTTLPVLRELVSTGKLAVHSKADRKKLQAFMVAAWATDHFPLRRNALVLGLHLDPAGTFETIRRKGLLRYYGYTGKKCPVSGLAAELLAELPHLRQPVAATDEQQLASIIQLEGLLEAYRVLDARIVQEMDAFQRGYPKQSLFKTLLAYADGLFLREHYPLPIPAAAGGTSRSKEEVAAAVSFLLHTLAERRPQTLHQLQFISDEHITSGRITRLVEDACLLDDLREAELLVESFQYRCIREKEGLRLIPPTEIFARSMHLGYIRSELQALQDVRPAPEAASMTALVTQVLTQKELVPFSLATDFNYPRYRLALVEPLFDYIAENLFKPDALFEEEIIYLNHIFKEQLLDYHYLTTVLVRDELTLLDFLKFQRVFHFLFELFVAHLTSVLAPTPGLVFRSLVPTFQESQLYEVLDRLAPAGKVETYLNLVCWEPGLPFRFDVQYHPILFVEQQFMLPISILAQSNYLRNLFASEYKRGTKSLVSDGTRDPLVAGLAAAFREVGLQCFEQVTVPGSDLDLLVVFKDTLFLLECKHSLLPVSAFDLRTTYDYIRKAETQLDHLLELDRTGQLGQVLWNTCQLDPKRPWRLVPGIVLGNRMFSGNAFRYPVRSVHELSNFVREGTLRTRDGAFSLWQGNTLTVRDLERYFSLDNALVDVLHRSLSKTSVTYAVGKFQLEKEAYYLDVQAGANMLAAYTDTLPRLADEPLQD